MVGEQNKFPIYIIYIWYTLVQLISVNSNSINKYYNINSVFYKILPNMSFLNSAKLRNSHSPVRGYCRRREEVQKSWRKSRNKKSSSLLLILIIIDIIVLILIFYLVQLLIVTKYCAITVL